MMARLLKFPVDETPELQRRAFVMKRELQRVFPEKSGEIAKWNFPKMHSPEKTGGQIVMFAASPYTETNSFESAHKPLIKAMSGNSNGKDQLMIIANHHDRASGLSQIKHACYRHTKFLSRGNESDSGTSSEGDDGDDDILTDPHTSRPCEMAARMPLWDMTFDVKALRREPFSFGKKGKGLQRIITAACKAGAPQAAYTNRGKGSGSGTKFSYNYSEEYPDLKFIHAQLGHFAYEYLRSSLGLEDLQESERDINGVLDSCLVRDSDGADLFTFGGIAIRSLNHRGTVRVRSRPFPSDQFFGRNPQVNARLYCVLIVRLKLSFDAGRCSDDSRQA